MWLRIALVLVLMAAGCSGTDAEPPAGSTRSDSVQAESDFRIAPRSANDPDVLFDIQDGLISHMDEDLTNEDEVLAAASPGQRAVYALVATDGEVNNGGFEQYFFNSTGSLMDEAIEGARLIGAGKHEDVLRAAAGVFPDGSVPNDRGQRQEVFDSVPVAKTESLLGALDERWYALDNELDRRLRAYIKAHASEFFRG